MRSHFLGPWRTSVAQALQNYARERLPALDGATQDASRINRYLRALTLDLVQVTKLDEDRGPRCTIELVPCPETRTITPSLQKHREKQSAQTQRSDRLRAQLARTMMCDVTAHQVQLLLNAMDKDGYKPATIGQERSLLRVLFNYARETWYWPEPLDNPASGRKLPKIDNKRERVISNDEWDRISDELKKRKNRYVAPALALLLTTTMRVSEALLRARWDAVDLDRCILKLRRAKRAAAKCRSVRKRWRYCASCGTGPAPWIRRRGSSPSAMNKAAWNKACARAGMHDAHIHDLRHTGATRYAIEYNGNMFVIKRITGHLTDVMVNRYVHLQAADVARMMHGRLLSEADAPAGLRFERLAELLGEEPLPDNVVRIDSRRRAA